ncbi:cytoplasmic FMR1-interacting protein [Histomonas meleagridis]|uniref:cytoplasmic FMR1-interacting protein n=1 Tax=Histomonas meleagridis TaxID=135588 RepID=UPI00355967DA|nr:cytoplasmic FMR1-interacting protein [Histomonas meleagridis]KAH0805797.1 cytoplasmic FMR1-interacting protein [Histomonas meleagridis]
MPSDNDDFVPQKDSRTRSNSLTKVNSMNQDDFKRKKPEKPPEQSPSPKPKQGRSRTTAPKAQEVGPILHFDNDGKDDGFSNIFASKEPCVIPPVIQLLYSPSTEIGRLDVPIDKLDCFDQIKDINEIISLTKIAKDYIPFLYSYRSIMKAINSDNLPPDQRLIDTSMSDKTKSGPITKIFRETFKGTIERLWNLKEFCTQISETIKKMFLSIQYEPSDVFFRYLTDLFDVVFNIDYLKLVKTGFLNDLAFVKRDTEQDEETKDKIFNLQPWVPSPYSTLSSIRDAINNELDKSKPKQSKYLHVFSKYLKYCVSFFSGKYVLPQEKNALIIGMISTIYIQSNPKNPQYDIFAQADLSQVYSIIEGNPIIPLYGENSFAPGYILAGIQGFKAEETNIATTAEKLKSKETRCLLKYRLNEFQEKYRTLLQITTSLVKDEPATTQDLLQLLQGIAEMSIAITRQSAFKSIVVAQVSDESIKKFDRAVRFNYTKDDLNALIEVIGYIKTLSCAIIKAEEKIVDYANTTVNRGIQQFIQNEIEQQLVRAIAAKDKTSINILRQLRDALGHWGNNDPNQKLASKSSKIVSHKIDDSNATVTINQIDIVRIEAIKFITKDSPFMKKISTFTPAHIRSKDVEEYQKFINGSNEWYYLIKYIDLVKESTNLGSLWFREVFLDMDKVLQFPVRSSLPFILVEHLLTTDNPSLHDSMLFAFEIYNDAAFTALNTFKSRYLFDEVQAEVSLCVDMIAFTFSETFYKSCREIAAQMELPNEYVSKNTLQPMRYNIILRQNRLEILGAAVDFNQIATGKLNQKMRKELESYIELLTDFRLAPYVAHLIKVAKTTHELLLQYHLQMDPFDTIWQRACQFTQPLVLQSRLSTLCIDSFDFDHMVFNVLSQRFIFSKSININPVTLESWAKEYVQIHTHETNYVGQEHFEALVYLLSPGELSILVQRLMLTFQEEVMQMFTNYSHVATSIRLLKPGTRDDLLGFYSFISDAYNQFTHPSLGALLNSMRVVGNMIAFIWCLDNHIPYKGNTSLISPFFNVLSEMLSNTKDLFIQEGLNLDEENTHLNYTFSIIWSVLEFIICSPGTIKLGENDVQLMNRFGDGPIFCAHTLITICNQQKYYEFYSLCSRVMMLSKAENTKMEQTELEEFLKKAKVVKQIKLFANVVAGPFSMQNNK